MLTMFCFLKCLFLRLRAQNEPKMCWCRRIRPNLAVLGISPHFPSFLLHKLVHLKVKTRHSSTPSDDSEAVPRSIVGILIAKRPWKKFPHFSPLFHAFNTIKLTHIFPYHQPMYFKVCYRRDEWLLPTSGTRNWSAGGEGVAKSARKKTCRLPATTYKTAAGAWCKIKKQTQAVPRQRGVGGGDGPQAEDEIAYLHVCGLGGRGQRGGEINGGDQVST